LFSGIESGVLSIDPVRLRQNVKRGAAAAVRLERLLLQPERALVTILLVTNAADIVGLLLLTRQCVGAFGNAGFLLSLASALPIYLFVLGVLPKALFRRFPFRALAHLAGALEIAHVLLWPLLEIGARLGGKLLPSRAQGVGLFAAREELKQITTQSEREGALSATERVMIHNVVDFRGVRVRDVMVPRDKVIAAGADEPIAQALERSAQTGVDRLPVLTNGVPTGVVNILDLLLEGDGATTVSPFTRRIVTATEDEPAYRIVERLRVARQGLAAVLDNAKNFRGIVTIEDLVRRLVSATESQTPSDHSSF
jgi:CBS domain containing-hemolysin-like protein